MKVRKVLGLGLSVPALVVALAQPSDAASTSIVTFGGTIQVTPTALPQQQQLDLCFSAVTSCVNGAESSGMAAGAAADPAALKADAVDGLQATATYTEACAPATAIQPVGRAELTGKVHDAVAGTWSRDVSATWTRAGLVAVIQGEAVGTALFTPAGVPACGRPLQVAVAGAIELAY